MSLFNLRWKREEKRESFDTVITAQATIRPDEKHNTTLQAIEHMITKKVMDDLAEKITKHLYKEILVEVEKDLIVREVSLKVSDNIVEKLFRKEK